MELKRSKGSFNYDVSLKRRKCDPPSLFARKKHKTFTKSTNHMKMIS